MTWGTTPPYWRTILVSIIVSVPASGCGHREQAPSADLQGTSATGGALIRGIGTGPDSLDLEKAESIEAQTILRDLYECLTSLDRNAQAVPAAATSWSASADGKIYTFTLRTDGRWSNGDRVTASDFVAGLRRLVDPATGSPYGAYISVVKNAQAIVRGQLPVTGLGVSAADELHLVMELEHPAPYFPALLSHPSTCPLHQPTLQKYGDRFSRPGVMVSNGAFVLTEWVQGDHISTTRNPYYWGNSQNHIDSVKWLQISDEMSEYLRYRADQVDVTASVPRSPWEIIKKQYADELHIGLGFATDYYGFNLSRNPFGQNVKLRRALLLAIDRDLLVDKVLVFGEKPANGWVPPETGSYQTQSIFSSEGLGMPRIVAAKRLYAEAGYSQHHPLHLQLQYNATQVHRSVAVAIASMWHETLGIDVDLVDEDFATLLGNIRTGQVEVFRSSWAGDYFDPQSFLEIFESHSGENSTHYRSEEYDTLLKQANEQADPAARLETLEHSERVLLRDAPFMPIYVHVTAHLVKPRVIGWYQNRMNVTYSKDLSISPEVNARSSRQTAPVARRQ